MREAFGGFLVFVITNNATTLMLVHNFIIISHLGKFIINSDRIWKHIPKEHIGLKSILNNLQDKSQLIFYSFSYFIPHANVSLFITF